MARKLAGFHGNGRIPVSVARCGYVKYLQWRPDTKNVNIKGNNSGKIQFVILME